MTLYDAVAPSRMTPQRHRAITLTSAHPALYYRHATIMPAAYSAAKPSHRLLSTAKVFND